MDPALFSVLVADLERSDRDLDEEIPVEWLAKAMEGTEARPRGTPGHLEVSVAKNGREVMVRGHARAAVTMPCARTLDPVDYDLDAEIFLLLAPGAPAHAGSGKAPKKAKEPKAGAPKAGGAKDKTPRAGSGSGKGGKKKDDEGAVLADDEAAHDTYDGEKVVLDPFVREFLVLELPMVPLREDLRSEATPAIERPPERVEAARSTRDGVDPRLAPLAAIASRLRDKKE
jgi:uncharacterized protein